jgi:hypothetical protein
MSNTVAIGGLLLLLCGAVPAAAADRAAVWSFDRDEVGKAPAGFESVVTGNHAPGKWAVVKDGRRLVLAQLDRDRTARRFAMALVKDASYKDVRISVKAKPVAGDVERVAGLVWRYQDADNYYVARWNTDSVRVDRVVKGERQLLTPSEIGIRLAAKSWHTLTVEHRGEALKVFVGKKKVFDGRDATYSSAGRIGVWIKADSVTHFDDLTVQALQ